MTLSCVAGAHYVEAWLDDRQIEGSPFLVEVFDTSSVLVAPPERATVARTVTFDGNKKFQEFLSTKFIKNVIKNYYIFR